MERVMAGSRSSPMPLTPTELLVNVPYASLCKIKIDIPRIPKKKLPIAAMEAVDVKNKWVRASLNNFDRFKVMLVKIKKGGAMEAKQKIEA